MRRRACALILTVITGLLAIHTLSRAAQPQPLRFQKQVVMDKQGFDMEAFRLLVPDKWRFQGGVSWNMEKFPAEAFIAYKVDSPDGRSLLQHYPHQICFWSQDRNLQASYSRTGAEILQPMNSVDYLRNVFLPAPCGGTSATCRCWKAGPCPTWPSGTWRSPGTTWTSSTRSRPSPSGTISTPTRATSGSSTAGRARRSSRS